MRSLRKRMLVVVAVLFAGALLADTPDPHADKRKAQAAIVNLGENLNAEDVAARAQKIVKEHASDAISSVFARKSAGGLGIGDAAKAPHLNSIDRLVRDWMAGRSTDADSLEKHHADYVKATQAIAAMAELAPYRMPDNVIRQQRDHAEWMRIAREFKIGAAELGKAVREKDAKQIRKAADILHHTCCDCHSML